jgi:hypothetical protein
LVVDKKIVSPKVLAQFATNNFKDICLSKNVSAKNRKLTSEMHKKFACKAQNRRDHFEDQMT